MKTTLVLLLSSLLCFVRVPDLFSQCNPDSHEKALLIHSDNLDGHTVFTDSSPGAHPIAASGDVHHETDQARFGASSIYFDGTEDYLEIADSDDWDFTTSDGTIDFWLRIVQTGKHHNIIGQARSYNDGQWAIYVNPSQAVAIGRYGQSEIKSADDTITPDVWYHVAVVRVEADSRTTIYVNGSEVATGTSPEWSSSTNTLRIGSGRNDDPTFDVHGYLDEIRVSKGVAVWTADFTPPDLPYCDEQAWATGCELVENGDGNDGEDDPARAVGEADCIPEDPEAPLCPDECRVQLGHLGELECWNFGVDGGWIVPVPGDFNDFTVLEKDVNEEFSVQVYNPLTETFEPAVPAEAGLASYFDLPPGVPFTNRVKVLDAGLSEMGSPWRGADIDAISRGVVPNPPCDNIPAWEAAHIAANTPMLKGSATKVMLLLLLPLGAAVAFRLMRRTR